MSPDWVNAYATWVIAIGTWVSIAVVIISVLILRAQIRDTRRAIRSASSQGSYTLWANVDRFFFEHPEFKPFVYEAKSLDSSAEESLRRRVESVTEMYSDVMANLFHQLPHFNPEEGEAYGNFLKYQYQTQPELKRFIDMYAHWYPNGYVTFLRSDMKWEINKAPSHQPGGGPHLDSEMWEP